MENEIRMMAKELGIFVNKNLTIYTTKDKQTRELIKRCGTVKELYEELTCMKSENSFDKIRDTVEKYENISSDDMIASKYSNMVKPFEHQVKYFNLSKDKKVFANFSEMGTGKTLMEIMVIGYLFEKGEIDSVVIIAPNGVHRQWVTEAIEEHFPKRMNPITAIWSSKANKEEKTSLDRILLPHNGIKILTINIEGLGASSERSYNYLDTFVSSNKVMLIVDESTRIKSIKAKRTKAVLKIGKKCKYKRILSGLYIPNGPLDLFTQFYFLDDKILGFSSYITFKSRYAVEVNPKLKRDLEIITHDKVVAEKIYNERRIKYITPQRLKEILSANHIYDDSIFANTWKILKKSFLFIAGYKNIEELSDKIKPYSYRVLKEECLDLPEKLFKKYETELSPEQKRMYDEIEDQLITEINGQELLAQHVLVKLSLLRQICGGTYRSENNDTKKVESHIIEGKIPRLDLMIEIINDIKQEDKIIIWACHRQEIEMIRKRLLNEYGPSCYAQIHGDITGQDREDQVARFKGDQDCRFLIGTAKSGGIGRNLTVGSYMIFYSNSMELEERRQAEDREHRAGQTKNVTIIDIYNKGLIDEKILKCLMKKQKIADQITKDPMSWKIFE